MKMNLITRGKGVLEEVVVVLFFPAYLVGTGTSVRSPITAAWLSLMKQESVRSRKSTSPTKILLASAPGGIFRIKCVLPLCCCCSASSVPLVCLAID